jgi:glycosyltransferase involved in cell wall biosynthesis
MDSGAEGAENALELVIAGTDSPNAAGYLQSVAQRYGDLPGLRFTGYVAEEDVPRIFGDAAVVVFPYTSTTGSSGVLHQAGDYGKAVVLPHIGDFAEVIAEEGYAGEFFEPGDPASLAAAIARVVDDPQRQRALGEQNYAASRGLPIGEVVDWYLLHFQMLIAEKAAQKAQRRGARQAEQQRSRDAGPGAGRKDENSAGQQAREGVR